LQNLVDAGKRVGRKIFRGSNGKKTKK